MTHPVPVWEARWSRRRVLRLASWIAVASSLVLVAAAGAGYALLSHYDANIRRLPGVVDAAPTAAPAADLSLDVLIVGSDSRAGLVGEEAFQGTGDEFVTGQRSDVVILAHVFADSSSVELVSLPRDAYVTIPAFTDPRSGRQMPARQDRLNSAIDRGGPGLLVQTVQQLTGVQIDHYVQVDFRGFKTIVDRLGGVQVCLSKPQKDFRSGIDLPAGRQVVQGEQALAFVRQRAGLARGDLDRIRRQQLLLGALVRKVLSAGTLLNPVKLNAVLQAATTSLQVDETLSTSRLRELALRLRSVDAGGFVFTTAPVADADARRSGASVVLLDEAASAQLFDRLRRDVPAPPPPPGAPPPPDRQTAAQDPCA